MNTILIKNLNLNGILLVNFSALILETVFTLALGVVQLKSRVMALIINKTVAAVVESKKKLISIFHHFSEEFEQHQ